MILGKELRAVFSQKREREREKEMREMRFFFFFEREIFFSKTVFLSTSTIRSFGACLLGTASFASESLSV